jgi:hypothetical protein
MPFTFKPAVRERTPLLLATAGPSGSGKTLSALLMALGICEKEGGKPALIDTEMGRALHYADEYDFDHARLDEHTPGDYTAAIVAAEKAKYPAIIVDSGSHVHWSVLDWHDRELLRLAGEDFGKRKAMNMLAWSTPKQSYKKMMRHATLACSSHLIWCLRAEPKVKMVKDSEGKTQVVDIGFQPICDSQFMFEMTASFLMSAEDPGMFTPIKLQAQHQDCFPKGRKIDQASGMALATWANGGAKPKRAASTDTLEADAEAAAKQGTDAFRALWKGLEREERDKLRPRLKEFQSAGEDADAGDPDDEPFGLPQDDDATIGAELYKVFDPDGNKVAGYPTDDAFMTAIEKHILDATAQQAMFKANVGTITAVGNANKAHAKAAMELQEMYG